MEPRSCLRASTCVGAVRSAPARTIAAAATDSLRNVLLFKIGSFPSAEECSNARYLIRPSYSKMPLNARSDARGARREVGLIGLTVRLEQVQYDAFRNLDHFKRDCHAT